MRNLLDWLTYVAARVAICAVQSVRIETCDRCAGVLAWLLTFGIPIRRQVIDENLRHAFPDWSSSERREMARRMWHHLFLMVFEVAHVPLRIRGTNWRQYVHSNSHRRIATLLLDPRPKVVVSGHFGNFEVAGYIAGLLGFPTYTIARPLDNRYLDRFLNRFRRATGQVILPKQGSVEMVQRVLENGGILALLGDQQAGPKGCWIDFFGRPASSHKAIALFCLAHNAPLAVVYARRSTGPLQFRMELAGIVDPQDIPPELNGVTELTQWYNQQLEFLIRETPEQYWWVHRRWKGEPPAGNGRRAVGKDTSERKSRSDRVDHSRHEDAA